MKKRHVAIRGIWVIVIILSLIFISFYGGTVSYGLFFAVLFLPLLSLIYLLMVFWRFKIYQKLEGRNVVAGQAVPYYFVLQNEDRFSFASVSVKMYSDFSYVEDVPEGDEYELLPEEHFRYDTYLICKYRGIYEVGIREVEIKDFLGFGKLKYHPVGNFEAIVRPKIVKKSTLKCLEDMESPILLETRSGQKEYDMSVRKYKEGDSVRRIHWKASARMQELMTREVTGEEKQGIALVMDTKRFTDAPEAYLPLENKELEALLAVGYCLTERFVSYDACYLDENRQLVKEGIRNFPEFDAFYEHVCKIEFSEEATLSQLLEKLKSETLFDYQAVFFVVHELDENLINITQKMKDRGTQSVILLIRDESEGKYQSFSVPGRRVFAYSTNAKLEEVL